WTNFRADNGISGEIVFAVPQDGEKTRTWGGTTFLVHAGVGGDMNEADWGIDGGWWGLRTTPEFVNLFPGGAETTDGRVDFWTGTCNGQPHSLEVNSITDFCNGYPVPKYTNLNSAGAQGSNPTFPDTDFPMFRLADAYLMYAEVVARGGGGSVAQAVQYVNALRERAYGGAGQNITAEDLTLDFILDERARELYWEGHLGDPGEPEPDAESRLLIRGGAGISRTDP
ncbi:MAG: RagB/SusD family nutrient uptake outer membrane protein, partial [Gemmatimonadota bacterium]